MRHIIVLFFVSLSLLYGYNAERSLSQADKWLASNNTSQVLKAYHAYKNVRINAIMEGSTTIQVSALKGVVQSGKKLHIDVSKYEKELERLGYSANNYKTTHTPKKETIYKAKVTKSSQKSNKLLSMKWRGGYIVLTFERGLEENEVSYFALDKRFNNRYRYIFDIKAEAIKAFTLKKRTLYGIRLGRYDRSILRLVLENKKELEIKYARKGRELIIKPGKIKSPTKVPLVKPQETFYVTKKRSRKVIVIDPGHGGKDAGAVGYRKYREKIIVYDIAANLAKELRAMGYTVYLTRTKGKFKELRTRTKYANNKNADLFISIHANSVPRKGNYQKHHGIETYFLSPAKNKRAKNVAAMENAQDVKTMKHFAKENFLSILNRQKILASNKLAIDLQKGMLTTLRKNYNKVKDGGVREGPFWVLVGAQMPAVLVEVGFITNPMEAKRLVNKTYQAKMAKGLALGVKRYFSMNP